MASRERVAVLVGMLAESFDRQVSDAMIEGYIIGIGDLTDEQLAIGARAALQGKCPFMPKPGELRALALTGGEGYESRADRAWTVLCKAIDKFGSGRSVNFRDALINATVRFMGGWEFICQRPVEEFEKWTKKDFQAAYTRFMQHGCPAELTGYLIGTNEKANVPWVGREYGSGGKVYELPAPEDIGCDYEPLLISAANQQSALTHRPANMPQLQLRKVE